MSAADEKSAVKMKSMFLFLPHFSSFTKLKLTKISLKMNFRNGIAAIKPSQAKPIPWSCHHFQNSQELTFNKRQRRASADEYAV